MADGKNHPGIKIRWKSLAVLLVVFLIAGLQSSRSWSQGTKFKAPIPKPSGRSSPGEAEGRTPVQFDLENEMKKVNGFIAANDKNADAYYNRGWLYEYKGNLQEAEKDYTKAIVLDGNHLEAYYNRGLIFARTGKLDQAIRDFSEVIRMDPNAADAYCNRGNARLKLQNPELAIKDYDAALEIRPDDSDILFNRGIARLRQGDKPKALDDLERAASAGHAKARQRLKSIAQKP